MLLKLLIDKSVNYNIKLYINKCDILNKEGEKRVIASLSVHSAGVTVQK